ncbi:hypothetical protein F2Q69_00030213 [Brassica cretica]|uniref:Uncharacterized protein n=1 Tax=Brassica cretica TaxID=69181 RepID=A0A8S9RX93_BRACR|nr:hypothetical protein F2Q69_00030213 [Brassica cretica]
MREWPNHQTDSWDLEGVLELYKMVKTSEVELQGLPTPSFEACLQSRVFVDDSLLERQQGASSRTVDSGVETPGIEHGSCLKRCRSQSRNHLWMLGCPGPRDYAGNRRSSRTPEVTARICEIDSEPGGVELYRV